MIQNDLLLILFMFMLVAMLTMISKKLRISYAILLVISGLVLGFLPNGLHIAMEPDLVFLIFLPPLLFEAAWNSSWKDLWKYKRSVSRLALGLVIFTSFTVAIVSHSLIPDFSLALGFLLGGIISPPDAVASTSVLSGLKVPRRIKAILEGESLINDASSLIVFRFALATILTGKFVLWKAGTEFLMVVFLGIGIGLLIAYLVYLFLRFLPTSPTIDTIITFIFPYLAYLAAEHFECSGVLAVVSGGLFLNSKAPKMLSYSSRLQMSNVWDTFVFLLNGAVFMMIGLQLPDIVGGLGEHSLGEAIKLGLLISLLAIVVRFVWVFPLTALFEWLRSRFGGKYFNPMSKKNWKSYFVIAWSGMRGVVSLASALAVPITLTPTQDFPFRNLILFITFVVILVTLVIQGLLLPFIIKWLGINEEADKLQVQFLDTLLAEEALQFIDENFSKEVEKIEMFRRIRERYSYIVETHEQELAAEDVIKRGDFLSKFNKMLLGLIETRRTAIAKYRLDDKFPEYILRSKENDLDLEEARLRKYPMK